MTTGDARLGTLVSRFDVAGIDALIVTNPTNIRYLTGFSGSAGTLVVSPTDGARRATLVTDNRYAIQAPDECHAHGADVDVRIEPGPGHIEIRAAVGDVPRVGLEADHVSWSERDRFEDELERPLVATRDLVEDLREIKSETEVQRIRAAASIADAALTEVRNELGRTPTERRIAALLDSAMRDLGADRPGFDTIVASGPNAARPHHQPSDRTISPGDLVIIDFGAELDGYRSDMTRSFSVGEPNARAAELLESVRHAQAAGVAAARPGVCVSEVDSACRSVLVEAGLGQYFTHGTGHGVGLDIHEAPSVSAKGTATLAPGHIITVEPGAYIAGFGGVRWEDTIVITESGAEPLTRSDKEAIVSIGAS